MCKVYTGYCGTSEIEHGLCACMVDNPSLKLEDYLSVQAHKPCSISHLFTLSENYHFNGAVKMRQDDQKLIISSTCADSISK